MQGTTQILIFGACLTALAAIVGLQAGASAGPQDAALPTIHVRDILKSFGGALEANPTGRQIWLKIPKVRTDEGGLMTVLVCSQGKEIGREVLFAVPQAYTYEPRIALDFGAIQQFGTVVVSEAGRPVTLRDQWQAGAGFSYERVGPTAIADGLEPSCDGAVPQ